MTTKNQILYGPPGTGKTYNTIVEAIKILNKNLYDKYEAWSKLSDEAKKLKENESKKCTYSDLKDEFDTFKENGRIEFVTFHQSYSYEEFVEGIKPYIPQDVWIKGKNDLSTKNLSAVKYVGQKGVFREICDRANDFETRYKILQEYLENNKLILKTSAKEKEFELRNQKNKDGCVVIPLNGDSEINITKSEINDISVMQNRDGYAYAIRKYIDNQPFVLIIDEINRGNISKIFGELITLIEPDKRLGAEHELKVTLPYSQTKDFGVPQNLYIIGTMNTADKSLALLDVALRRRFEFVPMYPNPELINKYTNKEDKKAFLTEINDKIKEDKRSADYLIGHAYFMNNNSFIDVLNKKVIPLLMEYYNGKQETVRDILNKIFKEKLGDKYEAKEEKYYLQVQVKENKPASENV